MTGADAAAFACGTCGAVLTAPLTRVALPAHTAQVCGHALLPPLLPPGTYAVNPEPSGPPWRPWTEITAAEAAARGLYAPVHALPDGPPGAVATAPGDVTGTRLIPGRCGGTCLGIDGRDGPNLACDRCGRPVATRVDDCGRWQVVWLDPRAVRARRVPGAGRDAVGWDDLRGEVSWAPPVEASGAWSPLWEGAVGAALAHVLAASGGAPVTVPAGLPATTFGHVLTALVPPGPTSRTLTVAGPGLPPPRGGIALVPRHPHTGQTWTAPPGREQTLVPLAADVWAYLASPHDHRTAALPAQARRDDPPPPHPATPFRPDPHVFLHTLARLPEARAPWLRAIHDHVQTHPYQPPF